MITEFKSKEQLVSERWNKIESELKEFFSEKEHGRLCRILKDEAKGDDRLVISNNVIRIKLELRKLYIMMEEACNEIKITKKMVKSNFGTNNKQQQEGYLELLNEHIETLKRGIYNYANVLVQTYIPLIDRYFTEHEIVQIIGGSYIQAKRIKEYYDKEETGTKSITDSFILHHVEYRWKKGRYKDFIDCPDWEMPLFNCVSSYIWKAIKSNQKARADMNNFFEDNFGEAMLYTACDSKGEIISTERIYQNLTQNELIMEYQGAFINDLKQKNIFDNETIYRIKRIDNEVYSVIGDDKKETAKIYKKIGLK